MSYKNTYNFLYSTMHGAGTRVPFPKYVICLGFSNVVKLMVPSASNKQENYNDSKKTIKLSAVFKT